jgi:hypothetical protein
MTFLEHDFPREAGYELLEVSSCDSCPAYPPAGIEREELKRIVREILRELEEESRR